MNNSFVHRYLIATRYALFDHLRNHTALLLLVAFVPLWDFLFWIVVPDAPLSFLLRATHVFLQVNGRDLTLLTAGLNAITLIIGFMFFSATRKSIAFDHRLILSGYPQSILILAKLSALIVVSAVVSLYTSLVLFAFWRPGSLLLVWLGFFIIGLAYGTFGLLLGVLVRGELEGFFLIIMVSLIDTSLQNPLGNPIANQDFLKWFPSYAPMQFVVGGAFAQTPPWLYLLYSLAWPLAFTLLGLVIFRWKTRAGKVRTLPHIMPVEASLHEHS